MIQNDNITNLFYNDMEKEDLFEVNKKLQQIYCSDTFKKLDDKYLHDIYINSKAYKENLEIFLEIFGKHFSIKEEITNCIQDEKFINKMISPGLKGVIRGNQFNIIIKNYISKLYILSNKNTYDIQFEKKHNKYETEEIPDFYIYDKIKDKILIGMNQIDLWNGGHQTNRCSKYVYYKKTDNMKLIAVVAEYKFFKSSKNKIYPMIKYGLENDIICYKKNLEKIINTYFT
jgi:hypothetical protein